MALTPDNAASNNDAIIAKAANEIELEIDAALEAGWHSGASMLEIPAPEFKGRWAAEIEHEVSLAFTRAGWKIERRQEPRRWIFKRAK